MKNEDESLLRPHVQSSKMTLTISSARRKSISYQNLPGSRPIIPYPTSRPNHLPHVQSSKMTLTISSARRKSISYQNLPGSRPIIQYPTSRPNHLPIHFLPANSPHCGSWQRAERYAPYV